MNLNVKLLSFRSFKARVNNYSWAILIFRKYHGRFSLCRSIAIAHHATIYNSKQPFNWWSDKHGFHFNMKTSENSKQRFDIDKTPLSSIKCGVSLCSNNYVLNMRINISWQAKIIRWQEKLTITNKSILIIH